MNRPRKMCSDVFMDKMFYVIGGMASKPEVLRDCAVMGCWSERIFCDWTHVFCLMGNVYLFFSLLFFPISRLDPIFNITVSSM